MNDKTINLTLDDLLFASIPSPARGIVIDASVTIERNIGVMLSQFLNIEIEQSKSLGMSSSALSFNHKINLLADMNIIASNEKAILNKFSEIRNLFAHNAIVTSFAECFVHNNIKEFLLKKYGQQVLIFEEDNCKMLFEQLYNDVKEICRNLFRKMMSKAGNEGENQGKLIYYENLMNNIEVLSENDTEFSNKIRAAHDATINQISRKTG